ncbi:tetratricopeptide repeat-containing glycosyltransferase family 2 protein [Methylorubrum salsuginis]|uniref:Glycosyl transferase family 2 n=1 Tax=Methylorubrum salsuginis TaxID=414703 RepID=A0A1I4MQ41_9HYPH|nr:glycosyltransferase [Methylorubrum salsuginis]SFM05157.1 Glycosyl transferase family 2 [Methylorubrum salsuginis]
MSVTAAIIVRNEEHFLPDCIRSLGDFVDEIVVVDTGSTDGTIDIARAAGASVTSFEWNGDFAAARNAALEKVATPWTLYIDADERVSLPGGGRIEQALDLTEHAGGYVRFRPRPGYSRYREPRLFRSDPSIRFKGQIHETIVPDLVAYARAHHLTLPMTPVCIDHFGFEGDQSHKVLRNIPLLEAEVGAHPDRAYCWNHLAEMLELDGRIDEAISACHRGLASTSEDGSIKDRMDRRQIAQTLARLLLETGEEADQVIERLLQEGHDDFATLYLAGRLALLRGDADSALRIGRQLTAIDTDALEIGMIAYDLRLFGEFAWALLGGAYHQAGRRSEAGEAYQQAWLRAPGNMAYLAKAAALGAAVGRPSDASQANPA